MNQAIGAARRAEDLDRIEAALTEASKLALSYVGRDLVVTHKQGGLGPVTEADHALNRLILEALAPTNDEGWLSEETVDDRTRLGRQRVWVVDPLDGTKEFLAGRQDWVISIGLVENGHAVAGGIANPSTGEVFIGSVETGVEYEKTGATSPAVANRKNPKQPLVLASESEFRRGEWKLHRKTGFEVHPVGSVAYKLALVAARLADATWTWRSKNEWDVAAGAALVEAAGGRVFTPDGNPIIFNRENTRLPGVVALRADAPAVLLGAWERK